MTNRLPFAISTSSVFNALEDQPRFLDQVSLVEEMAETADASTTRQILVEAGFWWFLTASESTPGQEILDWELVDSLRSLCDKRRYSDLFSFMRKTMLGDNRFDAVIAQAAGWAVIWSLEYGKENRDKLKSILNRIDFNCAR